jgi:hypothetical protein
MVDVAQLVEPRIVIPVVAGSSPVVHPLFQTRYFQIRFRQNLAKNGCLPQGASSIR